MRAVVVSPHLDDSVLSLGAALHRAVWRGWDVTVVTVMAGDPASPDPPNSWDAQAGFLTAGEAAAARRAEDRQACATLAARPVWLPFAEGCYARAGAEEDVWAAIGDQLAGASRVLLPGFPLEHPDHAWVARLVLSRIASGPHVGLYVEQPYALRKLGAVSVPGPVRDLVDGLPRWRAVRARARDRRAKIRACRAYRSQLVPLARSEPLVLTRILLSDSLRRGERVAWVR